MYSAIHSKKMQQTYKKIYNNKIAIPVKMCLRVLQNYSNCELVVHNKFLVTG